MARPYSRWLHLLLVSVVVHLAAASPALGQTKKPSGQKNEDAVVLFEKAVQRYRDGNFRESVDLLLKAYEVKPAPVLLYNLARAYEGLGEDEKALDAYQRYLEGEPKTRDRGAIEKRIETLKKQIADRKQLEKERDEERKRAELADKRPEPKPKPPPPPPPTKSPSAIPWIVAGVGAAGLVNGAVFGFLARSRHDDAENEPVGLNAADTQDTAEQFATIANISFIAGGLLTAGGIVWGVFDLQASNKAPDSDQARAPRLVISPTGVAVHGAF